MSVPAGDLPNILDHLRTMRAAAALAAASAWDAAPLEIPCIGFQHVTFYITYTRAAAGGDLQFRIEVSPYSSDLPVVEDWFRASLYSAGAVASGADTLSNLQREAVEYGSTAAGAENLVYGPLELRGTVERIRIGCRESGAPGTPGNAHIVALFW